MIELRAECNKPALAPESLIALTVSVYRAATNNNFENAVYLLNSGKLLTLVESLVRHLNVRQWLFDYIQSREIFLGFKKRWFNRK